jgi:hypothetical protein
VTVFGVPGAVLDRSAVLTVDQLSVVRAVATEGSGVRAGPAITALTTGWLKRMLFLLMFFLRDEEVCEGTGEGGTWWRRRVGRVTQMLGVLLRVWEEIVGILMSVAIQEWGVLVRRLLGLRRFEKAFAFLVREMQAFLTLTRNL